MQEPSRTPKGAIFDKMLKEPCSYHKGGANHKLEDYQKLKKYFDSLGIKKEDQRKDKCNNKGSGEDDDKFLEVHDCYMIYGGPSTQLIARQRKRECREVFAVWKAVP